MRKSLASILALALAWAAPGSASAQTVGIGAARSVSPVSLPAGISSLQAPGASLDMGLPTGQAPSLNTLPSLPSSPLPKVRTAAAPVVPVGRLEPLASAGLEVQSREGKLEVNGVEIPAGEQVSKMGESEARTAGDSVMDAILGEKRTRTAAEAVQGAEVSDPASGLSPSSISPGTASQGLPKPARKARAAGRSILASFQNLGWRIVSAVIGSAYAVRILHLHYPYRSWDHITGDLAADDKVKATNGEHPVGALREILNRTGWTAENPAGLSISFTPALMEIARKLWGTGWIARWREAINWRTKSGAPRMEMLLTGFHFLYGLLPWGPSADALIRWNVKYHELLNKEFWGDPAPGQMRIFRPPEVGFSPEMVPGLVKAGVQVVVVDSHHISRAIKGYDANGMPNLPPPNAADQRNASPAQMDYYTSGKDGRNTKDVLPYSLLPHWLRYTDPADGKEYKVIVFPMTGGPSYIAGYQDFPNEIVQDIAKHGPQGRPLVLGLDTDGDNAWGGGYSSYMEAMPRLAHWMDSNGHHFGTIQEYLTRYPVPQDDVLDWVEPGAWPNADWGTPQLSRWLWPPIKTAGVPRPAFDPSAWNFKLQFHALLTMAVHWLLQGEAAMKSKNPGWELDMAKVLKADTDPSAGPLEKAIQTVLRAFDSGHVYYSPEQDFVQIPLLAAKAAFEAAKAILGEQAPKAPPTIWGPTRFPWNPGGENRGEVYGWRSHTYGPEFDAYGFVYSAAGLKRVDLKWRASTDGRTSPSSENLRYDGSWNSAKMELKDPIAQAEWGGLPQNDRIKELPPMAHARVSPGSDVLVDYYIEAEDSAGRIQKSPIMHVYVGKG